MSSCTQQMSRESSVKSHRYDHLRTARKDASIIRSLDNESTSKSNNLKQRISSIRKHSSGKNKNQESTIENDTEEVKKSNYQNSIDPNVWGPVFWDMLFTFSFRCDPVLCKDHFIALFRILGNVLPCHHCRKSYSNHLSKIDTTNITDESESASNWLWRMHDIVNAKLGKICISYDKLSKKHLSLTLITHDFHLFDMFAFMTLASSEENRSFVIQAISIISILASNVNQSSSPTIQYDIPTILDHMDEFSNTDLWQSLYELKQRLYQKYGMPPINNIDEFSNQYENAIAT